MFCKSGKKPTNCRKYTIEKMTDQFIEHITQISVKYEKDHYKNT